MTQTWGSVTPVIITPKIGKSPGTVTIRYAAGETVLPALPTAVGTYSVYFDVAEATGWNGVTWLVAGMLTINPLVEIEMVNVPGGSFQMGRELGTAGSGDTTTVHTVTLSGFKMSKYEVTQKQYLAVMGALPPSVSNSYGIGDDYPVYGVSWYDALVFCNKVSIAEGLSPAYSISGNTDPSAWGSVPTSSNSTWNAAVIVASSTGYRLPTEAQWEYAAKGGAAYTYAGSNTIGNVAWYSDNSGSKTHEVGKKQANGLGLYDMSGNVWEWCWDWYSSSYYGSSPANNPSGPAAGDDRVVRGGGWDCDASYARLVNRGNYYPYGRFDGVGFRLVRP